ncbi:MAG TPA: helix-turn-helix domain-containing protein [Candidatus Heimdallarchaeota archaeon]|nr:helix-turn-helix domain-containing protein [Candidatus Heimdallarchaeota archaeon]
MLTIKEVAEKLGVHEVTVREWINNGNLPAIRLPGGRAIRIRPEDLEAHITKVEPKAIPNENG